MEERIVWIVHINIMSLRLFRPKARKRRKERRERERRGRDKEKQTDRQTE